MSRRACTRARGFVLTRQSGGLPIGGWPPHATPSIAPFGALLDAVVEGLRRLSETRPPKLPRMADFALWAMACESALWPAGTFWSAYCGNRDEAVEGVIDADPIATAMRAVMTMRTEWTGTALDLLGALAETAGEPSPGPRPNRIALGRWPAAEARRNLPAQCRHRGRLHERRTSQDTHHPHHHHADPPGAGMWRGRTVRTVLPEVNGGNDFAADTSRAAADGRAGDNRPVLQGSSAPTR